MPFECPHCKGSVPGVIEQTVHTERLALKQAALDHLNSEHEALKQKLGQYEPRIRDLDTLTAEVGTLKTELEKARANGSKLAAVAKVGFNPDKIRLAEVAYEMAHEGVEESKRPAFTDWLIAEDGGRSNPDIRHHYTQAASQPATPPAPGGPVQPPRKEPPAPGAPPHTSKPTPQQIAEYFRSEAFRSLPRDQQKAKAAELEAQVRAAPTTDGRV